jgi:anti-sigma factor RsiW
MKDNRTTCTDVSERLSLYVGGDLEDDAADLVREHLAGCASCSTEASAAARSREVFRASLVRTAEEPSRSPLWTEIRSALVSEGLIGPRSTTITPLTRSAPEARPTLRLVRRAASFAAAAAVLALASIYGPSLFEAGAQAPGVLDGSRSPVASTSAAVDPAPVALEPGERMLTPQLGRSKWLDAPTLDLRMPRQAVTNDANALASDMQTRGLPLR